MRWLIWLLALPLGAQSPEALAQAERSFAQRAAATGTRAAFLAHLAEDGLIFRPRAVAGKPFYAGRPDDGSRLAWAPAYVELSSGGDFGISTGPFDWAPRGRTTPEGHGHFLSVWAHREGRWQVLLDVGVPHPDIPPPQLQARRSTAPALAPEFARRSLLEAEEALDQLAVTLPYTSALREWAASDLRIYRPGVVPAPGNFKQLCRYLPARLTWVRKGLLLAPAGDLACTWGETDEAFRSGDGQVRAARSSAVRIWRREREADWKLVVDLAIPIP